MKISLAWLKDYIQIPLSPEKLAHKLTMAGLEVEKIERVGEDTVFELEITPNRPDCLSVLGIAREVSAILNKPVKPVRLAAVKKSGAKIRKPDITIEDKKDCPRYIGAIVQDVCIKESPEWVKKRLSAIGSKSINNIVDVTNFCLMETGQPLHAFDYDKLAGGKIVVRRARKGEKITTFDGVERVLDPSVLVIADAKRPVAVAGIMGGMGSEVTGTTKKIFLESAYFDPILIRRASRSLGLSSDSSYRFERGVDIDGVDFGAKRASGLIRELAGGSLESRTDAHWLKQKKTKTKVCISKGRVEALLGAEMALSRCRSILKNLGCAVSGGVKSALNVTAPSFRLDLKDEVDFIEEIARIIGYDNLPMSFPQVRPCDIARDRRRQVRDNVRRLLLSQGFHEAVTYAMTNRKDLEKTQMEALPTVKVKNPLTLDQELMRPGLAPSLLPVFLSNVNRGQKNVRLFETGKIYSRAGEKETLGIIAAGRRHDDWRELKTQTVDFYDVKGALENILRTEQAGEYVFRPAQTALFEKNQGASVVCSGKEVGCVGHLARGILDAWGIKEQTAVFAQMDLEWLAGREEKVAEYYPPSGYPAIVLDVSLAIKEEVSFQQVRDVIDEMRPEDLSDIRFNEQYLGEKIPPGHRGIVFSLVYQSASRTLREDEVSAVHEEICRALVDRLGAVRR